VRDMKTCRENHISVLSLGVLLKDVTTPDKNVIGNVFLKAHRIKKQPLRHSTGYFLFIDLPKGKYHVTAGGKFYEQEDFIIDTDSVKPEEPFIELFLKKIDGEKGGNI